MGHLPDWLCWLVDLTRAFWASARKTSARLATSARQLSASTLRAKTSLPRQSVALLRRARRWCSTLTCSLNVIPTSDKHSCCCILACPSWYFAQPVTNFKVTLPFTPCSKASTIYLQCFVVKINICYSLIFRPIILKKNILSVFLLLH